MAVEDVLPDLFDLINGMLIVAHTLLDPLAGVEDRGVIASSELLADRLERSVRQITREVDRDLAWPADPGRPGRRVELGRPHAVMGADRLLDRIHRHRFGRLPWVDLVEYSLREADVQGHLREGVVGDDPDQSSLERAHVVCDPLGDEFKDGLVLDVDAVERGPLAQDRDPSG